MSSHSAVVAVATWGASPFYFYIAAPRFNFHVIKIYIRGNVPNAFFADYALAEAYATSYHCSVN